MTVHREITVFWAHISRTTHKSLRIRVDFLEETTLKLSYEKQVGIRETKGGEEYKWFRGEAVYNAWSIEWQ